MAIDTVIQAMIKEIPVLKDYNLYFVGVSYSGKDGYEPEFESLFHLINATGSVTPYYFTRPHTKLETANLLPNAITITSDMFCFHYHLQKFYNMFFFPRPDTDYWVFDEPDLTNRPLRYANLLFGKGVDSIIFWDIHNLTQNQLQSSIIKLSKEYDTCTLCQRSTNRYHILVKS